MEKCYIGIDPGANGFAVCLNNGASLPFKDVLGSLSVALRAFIFQHMVIDSNSGTMHVCIEHVHAMPYDTPKTAFALGKNIGQVLATLDLLKVSYTLVSPKAWQTCVWTATDIVTKSTDGKKNTDTKATSIRAAQRLFPMYDLRRTDRCKVIDNNKCDALLIAEYARRKNL